MWTLQIYQWFQLLHWCCVELDKCKKNFDDTLSIIICFQDWSSTSGKDFFLFISQTSVLMSTAAGISLILNFSFFKKICLPVIMMVNYFTFLNYTAHKEYNKRIEEQLKTNTDNIRELEKTFELQKNIARYWYEYIYTYILLGNSELSNIFIDWNYFSS